MLKIYVKYLVKEFKTINTGHDFFVFYYLVSFISKHNKKEEKGFAPPIRNRQKELVVFFKCN